MDKKSAFTIIEVVFVIMIIGILAVVIIPKLSATRDDAKIAIALNDLGTLVHDLSSFYTTKDFFVSNISSMTYLTDVNYSTPWSNITQHGKLTFYVPDNNDNLEKCVLLEIHNQDGNLTISSTLSPTGDICIGLQSHLTYKKLLGTKLLGGNKVKF